MLESEEWEQWHIAEHALTWDPTIRWKKGEIECPSHMECLQILLENEKPVCFYTAVGDAQTYSYNLARRFREKSVKPLAKAANRPALCKGFLVFYTF